MSRSEVSQRPGNLNGKMPERKSSLRNAAPLSSVGHLGYGNVPIDFDAKTVMKNPRDDASSVSALPAPARCQETSFDTNSQINMFYNNSEIKNKKSQGTATFVELRASQEIERIPGAKSPFLRLSDNR